MKPSLSLGISPCPNDTFIFHALINGLAPQDPEFSIERVVMDDVENLNGLAARAELDVVKISVAALAQAAGDYVVLPSGSALGRGCGPLCVARTDRDPAAPPSTLALPGARTTAALLAEMAGTPGERVYLRYDQVMPAVMAGEVEAGVLIHEGRFTYADHGLACLTDYGQWWEDRFGLPLPLGVILARRSLGPETIAAVGRAIRQSLSHAYAHPEDSAGFIAKNAQELSPEVTASHIATFVTDFSLDLGPEGRHAIAALADAAFRMAGRKAPEGGLFA